MRVRQIGISLLLALASLAAVGTATASAAPGATLSSAGASRAIEKARRLLDGQHRARRPRQLTTTLLSLSRSLPRLDPAQRAEASALLARPTDSPDPAGSAYAVPEHSPPYCTLHFCVHWVDSTQDAPDLTDSNGNAVPDYVELVGATAEDSFRVENTALGWQAAKPDGAAGGDSRVDIYIVQLGGELFGYSAPDPGQGTVRSQYAYLVVDDDYSPSEFPNTVPLADLEVTFAHEYNHVLQFSYDVFQDLWMYEVTAVWMEDQVYPAINDYFRYIRRWVTRSKLSLTLENIKIYGSAVWAQWLAGRYGPAVVRSAWEHAQSAKPAGFSVKSFTKAIKAAGGKDLEHEFALFAAATAEWRTPGVFPYPDAPLYLDVERRGKLHVGRFVTRRISHLGYLLMRVRPRHVRLLRLLAGTQQGPKGAFALVCREGPVESGTVRIKMKFAKHGGIRGVNLRRPGRCSRITAVLINADPRQAGFLLGDWVYLHDHTRFAATLIARG